MKRRNRTLPLLAASVLLPTTGSAALLAHYSFDSDFTDGSGNSNDLTAEAGTDPTITSTVGQVAFGLGAVDLDGNDWLNMTTTLNFGATDAWSVAFWGRRGAGAATQDGMVLGEQGSAGNFIWTPDNGSVVQGLRFRNATNNDSDFGGFADDGNYHHWAVVADGAGNLTVYRDNTLLSSVSPTGGTVFTASDVGQAFNQAGQIYLGQLDELYIFDEAIDSTIVDGLFTSNTVIPEPGSLALLALGALAGLRRKRP